MPAPDFIPTSDADFIPWSAHFFAVLNANLATVERVIGDVTPVQTIAASG